jgi:dTDP-4-dehydrorhamnose 3,5-epimerase
VNLQPTAVGGVFVATGAPVVDARGEFARWFCELDLSAAIGDRHIVQINHSRTACAGTVRGMHFQRPPHAEMKLVRCLRGRAWDVALDLRAASPTLLRWHAEELSPGNGRMLVIPEGCAHGFQALEPETELLYLHTAAYQPSAEGGVNAVDALIAIAWPLPVANLSERDARHPALEAGFAGIRL